MILKFYLLLLNTLLIFNLQFIQAQSNPKIYFDSQDNNTSETLADYYITYKASSKDRITINGFYITGEKKFEGNYLNLSKSQVNYEEFNTPEFADKVIKQGDFKEWYKNGNLKEQATYNQGSQLGDWYQWFESGKLRLKIKMKNGREDGEVSIYYENGQLKMRWIGINGDITEEVEQWDENGEKILTKEIEPVETDNAVD